MLFGQVLNGNLLKISCKVIKYSTDGLSLVRKMVLHSDDIISILGPLDVRTKARVTFGTGVVSRPLLLLLPDLKDGTEPSCLEAELRDSGGDGAFGPLSSSGWAKAVASTKNHQNFISSLLPLSHGIVAPTFHSFVLICSSPNLSLFVSVTSPLPRTFVTAH